MKVESVQSRVRQKVGELLDEVKKQQPTEVVVWYNVPGEGVNVVISEGTSRTKAVGALMASAFEVWEA